MFLGLTMQCPCDDGVTSADNLMLFDKSIASTRKAYTASASAWGDLLVSDFGLSAIKGTLDIHAARCVGTVGYEAPGRCNQRLPNRPSSTPHFMCNVKYMAPHTSELLQSDKAPVYTEAVDVWAMGVIL